MSFEWHHFQWLFAAPAALILILISGYLVEARKKYLARLFSKANLSYSEASSTMRSLKWICMALCLTFLCLSLADPRYGVEVKEVSRTGRDIVFILDVSKSMLATDINGISRLKRSKLDIIEAVSQMQGHRVGLIGFAGKAKELCPLTYDYYYFIKRLREVTPASIPKGGTNIGDALREALELVRAGAKLGHYKDLILITDGQDHEGYYEQVAKEAASYKVSIFTVGIGQASPTSIRLADGTYLMSEGKQVQTALDPEPLKLISQLSGEGYYLNLLSNPRWLQDILAHIDAKEKTRNSVDKQERKIPRYYYFLILSLISWALSVILPDRKRGAMA
ncbi:MAG: VWA domain-containing protein [Planctomycetes bacterium]|nr:VWA domain-containing protein [Planctomycetota bacterium]